MSKPSDLTPWQTWAQAYLATYVADRGTPREWDMDSEDADRYAHASWEACKMSVLEILMRYEYISLDALEEIQAL